MEMKKHIYLHRDYYSIILLSTTFIAFSSYCVIELLFTINFWCYLLLLIIGMTLYIFITSVIKWYMSAINLFSTIITDDDKNLYIKLTDEFGNILGDILYYKAKRDARLNRYHFGESRKRKDLSYLTKEFRLNIGELK